MSRPYRIRWTSNDELELKKAVRNYNAKITRLQKKDPKNKNVLPVKTSVAQMKNLIETRQDLKREINSLKRFSKRGAETIVEAPNNDYSTKITKWQKTEMNRRAGIVNRKRAKRKAEIESTEVKSRGKKTGYTRGQIGMGKQEEQALRPINAFTKSMTKADIDKKFAVLKKESQSVYWDNREMKHKQDYINALKQNYNEENIKDVIEAIEKMDYKEFRKVFDEEDPFFEYSSFKRTNPENEEQFETALRTIWLPKKG